MAVAALVLVGLGIAVAVVARMVVQVRRTGDTGFRASADAPPSHLWVGGLLVVSCVAMAFAPVAALAGLGPVSGLDVPALNGIGVVLAVAGLSATFAAQLGMGNSWRMGVDTGERTELVTTGAFGLVRNPIYSAAIVFVVGLALMVPNVIALAALACFLVAFELLVRVVEEPHLAELHGDAFRRYTASVGRFVPKVGRAR